MLKNAIALIVGFVLGYGVREWFSRRRRQAERQRRQAAFGHNSLGHDALRAGRALCPAPARRLPAVSAGRGADP